MLYKKTGRVKSIGLLFFYLWEIACYVPDKLWGQAMSLGEKQKEKKGKNKNDKDYFSWL